MPTMGWAEFSFALHPSPANQVIDPRVRPFALSFSTSAPAGESLQNTCHLVKNSKAPKSSPTAEQVTKGSAIKYNFVNEGD
jgi:hypothetical protein